MVAKTETIDTPLQPTQAPVLSGNCEAYQSLVSQYNWDVHIALAVMRSESGCRANAYNGANSNGTNDAGLFQINSIHVQSGLVSDAGRYDPAQNIRAAYAIYSGNGWRAWAAFNNGSYQKYM